MASLLMLEKAINNEKLSHIESTMLPIPMSNIDTDQIMPKQFLKRVERSGYGEFLFYD